MPTEPSGYQPILFARSRGDRTLRSGSLTRSPASTAHRPPHGRVRRFQVRQSHYWHTGLVSLITR
jgi:hypothetical protein